MDGSVLPRPPPRATYMKEKVDNAAAKERELKEEVASTSKTLEERNMELKVKHERSLDLEVSTVVT